MPRRFIVFVTLANWASWAGWRNIGGQFVRDVKDFQSIATYRFADFEPHLAAAPPGGEEQPALMHPPM